jgi:hypothetical protein
MIESGITAAKTFKIGAWTLNASDGLMRLERL